MARIPKLDRRITLLERVAVGQDSAGQLTFDVEEYPVWAARRDRTRDATSEVALTEVWQSETRFVIRWRAGVDTTWSLRDSDGETYSIEGVGEMHGRRRFLELVAVRR